MNIVQTLTQADAIALQAAVDAQLGYPKNGVDVGGGLHVPAAQSRTTTAAAPMQKAASVIWGLPIGSDMVAVIGAAVPLPGGAAVVALDNTWLRTFTP